MNDQKNILNQTQNPMGILFDTINYYDDETLNKFSQEMTDDQALFCIIEACNVAYKRNAYSMIESEILSKAIRKISKPSLGESSNK